MGLFCREFNEQTKNEPVGKIVNVRITAFSDKTYQFIIKGSPTTKLIKGKIGDKKVITRAELRNIAQEKLIYLNTDDLEKAEKIVGGTAQSARIKVID